MKKQDVEKIVNNLLAGMGFTDAEIGVEFQKDRWFIQITTPQEQSGVLIGFHGEKIDALKTILNLMINSDSEDFTPVQVNVNDYRERRQQSVEELADRAVEKALSSNREILLPPLPANERRLVHIHLKDRPDIETYSEGRGNQRRVIVSPSEAEPEE